FTNGPSLFINSVDGVSGITTTGGAVAVTVSGAGNLLSVQNAITAGNANVTLSADDMDLQAAVSGGTQRVTLQPTNSPRTVSLGSNTGGTLGLLDAELDRVTAGVLRIGDPSNTGPINVTGQITQAGSGWTTLSLKTGGAIVDFTGTEQTDITVTNLSLQAATGIGDGNDLNVAVTNLAATNSTNGNIQVTDAVALTIPAAAIDGVTGVTNNGPGNIGLASTSGGITVSGPVLGGAGGSVSLVTSGANGAITVTNTGFVNAIGGNGNILLDTSAGASGQSAIGINDGPLSMDLFAAGTGNITLRSNDAVTLSANVVVQSGLAASGGGTITLQSNFSDVNGTDNIVLGANSQILTRGTIVLNADPDG